MKNILFILSILIVLSCTSKKKSTKDNTPATYKQRPGIVVYKTKADYANLVPVAVSDDKSKLISYPAPTDLKLEDDKLRLPVELANGYLLDRKGIWLNVAFLNMDYESYANMETSPLPKEIEANIRDNDPLLEFYHDKDNALESLQEEKLIEFLNELIRQNRLDTELKKLK